MTGYLIRQLNVAADRCRPRCALFLARNLGTVTTPSMLRASWAVACCCAMRFASEPFLVAVLGREAADRSTSKQLSAGPTIPASPAAQQAEADLHVHITLPTRANPCPGPSKGSLCTAVCSLHHHAGRVRTRWTPDHKKTGAPSSHMPFWHDMAWQYAHTESI